MILNAQVDVNTLLGDILVVLAEEYDPSEVLAAIEQWLTGAQRMTPTELDGWVDVLRTVRQRNSQP